jgi:hypothetical protein
MKRRTRMIKNKQIQRFKGYHKPASSSSSSDQSDAFLNDDDDDHKIPISAKDFYHDFGFLIHPNTHRPVVDLTDYQYNIWDSPSRYRLVVKSQKTGLSTSALLEDFQKAITVNKGQDILLIAQSQAHANEHLLTLKSLIVNSEKYRKYLLLDPSEGSFKEEKSKLSMAYFRNPGYRTKSRIIGVGMSEGIIWSWKNIGHIHMSDPTAADVKDDAPIFAAAFSRLANTRGTMLIETPPRGPRGKVFEIYQQSLTKQSQQEEARFEIFHVTAQDAVRQDVISQEFLDEEKVRLGSLYPQYYEAEFIAVSGNIFAQSAIDAAITEHKYNPDIYRANSAKWMAVDQGYQSSKFAIILAEWDYQAKKARILLAEEFTMPTTEEMINRILVYRAKYGNILKIAYDATNRMEFGSTLKQKIDEPYDIRYIEEKLAYAKKNRINIADLMHIVPIIFSVESKGRMMEQARRFLEDPRHYLAINERFVSLITGLRSAVFDDKGQLDKGLSPHNDLIDAFLMLCQFFPFRPR